MPLYVEQIGRDIVVAVQQHSGHGECVATIVSWSGEDDDTCGTAPHFCDGLGDGLGCTLHQIDGFDGLVFNRIFVQFVDLGTRKNLHNGAKVGKRFGDSKNFSYFCTKITYSAHGQY